jgi:hypothetical protein
VRGQSFEESPAIVRTAEGMAAILELEQSLDAVLSAPGPSSHAETFNALLRSYIGESDSDADCEADSDSDVIVLDGPRDKRKPFVFTSGCTFNANKLITEMVYVTHVRVSVRASTHPIRRTL